VASLVLLLATAGPGPQAIRAASRQRIVARSATITAPRQVRLNTIPPEAQIAFHRDGLIFVMDENGGNVVQITFDEPRVWEHVAVSPDRRFIVGNEQMPNPENEPGGRSRLWIFDLQSSTVAQLLPSFRMAGNGGVDWDPAGFIYFAARESRVYENPATPEEFRANAGANDVYRIRPDGSGLQRLLATPLLGEADVSVSEDGSAVAFIAQPLGPGLEHTEVWLMAADGTAPRMVFRGGQAGVASVHDPELSPDNAYVVFSMVNSTVPPNFPENPLANTAHDIWQTRVDGSGAVRLTRPGPISIAPDWKGDSILYLDVSERDRYGGISLVQPHQPEQLQRRIQQGGNIAKWIPSPPRVTAR
jgi:Tol biopolymer transport system component